MADQMFAAGKQVLNKEQNNDEQSQPRYTEALNGVRGRTLHS
jgi:hypothetical protein